MSNSIRVPSYLPQNSPLWVPVFYPNKIDNDEQMVLYIQNQIALVDQVHLASTKAAIVLAMCCAIIDFGLAYLKKNEDFTCSLLTKIRSYTRYAKEFVLIENELKRLGYSKSHTLGPNQEFQVEFLSIFS